jgi:hypothetical protein
MLEIIVVLYAAFLILQMFDILTTMDVLLSGGREMNGALSWLMDRIGMVPALLAVKLAVALIMLAAIVAYPRSAYLAGVIAVVDAIYVAVVAHNYRQTRG